MSKERELLQKVLAFLETDVENDFGFGSDIKKLLAQPESMQEPVAWMYEGIDETGETVRSIYHHFYEDANLIPLYTSPPKRESLGLEIMDVCGSEDYREGFKDGALYAEKCHGIGVSDE